MRNWSAALVRSVTLVLLAMLAACGGNDAEDTGRGPAAGDSFPTLSHRFPGTWELEAIELKNASGDPIPAPAPPAFGSEGAIGQLMADAEGHIGLAVMQQGRPAYEDPTPEQAAADVGGYTALFGTYEVMDASGLLTVQIRGSRDPRLTGTVQTSVVAVDGNQMAMEWPLRADGIQPTFRWRRLSELPNPTLTHQRVFGFWHHVPNEGHGPADPPIRPGYIIYSDAGRMMVHLMDPDRAAFAGPEPTPEEAQALVTSYTSYFGPFTVDEAGGYFVHHRIGHTLNLTDRPQPERRTGLDTDAQRFFEFVGDRMVLRYLTTAGVQAPPPAEPDWGGMITWERLSQEAR